MTRLTARKGSLEIGIGSPTVLINDQLRVMDQTDEVLSLLKDEWIGILPKTAQAIHADIGCPISLDTRDPAALDAALEIMQPYKCLVNSVSAEPEPLETLLPVAAKYNTAVVAMPVGGGGIPATVEERIEQPRIILDACQKNGNPQDDIIVDAICLASSAVPGSLLITLETPRTLSEDLKLATTQGIGNAGFGMPDQTVIDLANLIAAIPWGLHSALVDPKTVGLVETVRAMDFLIVRDEFGARYIQRFKDRKN
ncbi:MAG: dihydropteroate synthase [Chloroflexi bacterium]|nr:dihydropteroate synthase [Chloroflexota bacterium]